MMEDQEHTKQRVNTESVQASPQSMEVIQLPAQLSLSRSAHGLGNHYVIGQHRTDPLLAVTTHSGFHSTPDVVLHGGPTKESPMLAGIDSNVLVHSTTAKLCLPGYSGPTGEKAVEIARQGGAHRFDVDNDSGHPVTFEWIPHTTTKTSLLGGSKDLHWQLVRYNGTKAGNAGVETQPEDVKHVVATWANEGSMSLTKVLSIEFLEDTNRLATADAWVVMALITALRIWDCSNKSMVNKQMMTSSS